MPYATAERVVRDWLADYLRDGYRVVTVLPPDLTTVATTTPVVQVQRFGGSAQPSRVLDAANIDVDYFDVEHDGNSAYLNSQAGAEVVRAGLLWKALGAVFDGGSIVDVTEINGPRWVPYDNTNVRRFVASYRITIHSVPNEGVI